MINQEVIVNQQLQERIHYDNPDFPLAVLSTKWIIL